MTTVQKFARFAWGNLIYLILVILWGAWVRITGSGAGCGAHWPNCNGEIIPPSPTLETLIEFTHRLTSGLSLPLVLILLIWGFKLFPKGHRVRYAAVGTLAFLLSEAALGAGLVKFELVADNTSLARAITASLHLVNTFTLSAFAALTAWWAQQDGALNPRNAASLWLWPALIAVLISSMMGAVTALGDTLFPTSIFTEQGLVAHIRGDLVASTHFLVQLRIVHPFLAVATGIYLLIAIAMAQEKRAEQGNERTPGAAPLSWLVGSQLLLGAVNILLAAPGWIQILHLLLAVCIWLGTLLYWVALSSDVDPERSLTEREGAVS